MKLIYKSDRHEIEIWKYDWSYTYYFIHGNNYVDGKIECRCLTENEVNVYLNIFRQNHLRMWHADGKLETPIGYTSRGNPITRKIKIGKTNTGYENFYKQLIRKQ